MDYFSLDIEGNELDVLKTIPFQKYDIKVSKKCYVLVVGKNNNITTLILVDHSGLNSEKRVQFMSCSISKRVCGAPKSGTIYKWRQNNFVKLNFMTFFSRICM